MWKIKHGIGLPLSEIFVVFLDSDDCRVIENKGNNLFHMVQDSKHGIRNVHKLNNEEAREYLKTKTSY